MLWEETPPHRTTELLEKHRPKSGEEDQRGFEWHYLNRLMHREVYAFNAQVGGVLSINWIPGGQLVAHF